MKLKKEQSNLKPLIKHSIKLIEGDTLTVSLEKNNENNVLITISDTGGGIREEDLVHIFDPYYTSKPSGTGLGLAIVHKIVEAHGGEIKVESRVGEGTNVTIILPL